MPRRREVPKRDILPDPKFGNVEVSKFVNTIMKAARSRLPSESSMAPSTRSSPRAARIPWRSSARLWATSNRWSRSRAVVSVVPTIRCPWRCVRVAGWRWRCAGCARLRASAPRNRWDSVSPPNARGFGEPRWCGEEARRSASHGRSQQGLRAFPLLRYRS
jgi:hypothetical protein